MDKQNIRLILAVAISFVIIVVWSKLMAPEQTDTAKQQEQVSNTTSSQTSQHLPASAISNQNIQESDTMKGSNGIYQNKEILVRIESSRFDMDIDVGGAISQVYLKEDKYTQPPQEGIFTHIGRIFGMVSGENKKLDRLPLFATNVPLHPLQVIFANRSLDDKASAIKYSADKTLVKIEDSPQTVTLTQDLGDLVIEKVITINPDMTYQATIKVNKPIHYVISNGMRPNADSQSYVFHGVVLKNVNGKLEKIEDGDAKDAGENFNDSLFVASVDRYYASILFSPNISKDEVLPTVTIGAFGKGLPRPFINISSQEQTLMGYIGPKDHRALEKIDKHLVSVVEYGIITFFAKYIFILLDLIHGYVGNWGVAIIFLTILIRIILFPLTLKGMVSMQKLKDIAPKMKEIQQKHKGDPQKMQAAMMELYKKHGANPFGGCLPLVLQIPVFFAIYRVLYNAVELKNASFALWIHDLSVMDPYFVLPVLMGISMYVQQSLTPSTFTDPMQAKVFKWLPVIFTIFLITFPAGLILYWTINNVISIIQQMVINKVISKNKGKEK